MPNHIRIFIADDNRLLREGLVSMLAEQQDIAVIGKAPSGNDALAKIIKLCPDIALIDIGMPDKDGIELTKALYDDVPQVKVVILGMIDLTDEIMQCIEAGAAGYVLKEGSFDALVETIRSVHRGESFCSPQMTASLFSRIAELASEKMQKISTNSVKLTARELDVIHLIAEGLPNKEIANRLFIETQTVKNHVHNILDKLQLKNRLEAVQYARDRNLLETKK